MEEIVFQEFDKIARYSRGVVVTEKIDGTNATIYINGTGTDNVTFATGSRNRWITPQDDNYGFSRWAHEHKGELLGLGDGWHRGEWWGAGIQRRYGMTEKVFSLFNVGRWNAETPPPACCRVVPVLWTGMMHRMPLDTILQNFVANGSAAAPGFMDPEGVVIYHSASKTYYKKTVKNDDQPKIKVQ
jgi:hypothetical protein